MSRPVVKAGVAGAILFAFNGLCLLAVPVFLPSWRIAWLAKPLIGLEVAPPLAHAPSDLAVSAALAAGLLLSVGFVLAHCVINQPRWALLFGWGALLGGGFTSGVEVLAPRMVFVDINHGLWSLGVVEIMAGALVVVLSWWRAPEFISPYGSRFTGLAWFAAVVILDFVGRQTGTSETIRLALGVVISLVALTAGSWIAGRSSAQSGGDPDPA